MLLQVGETGCIPFKIVQIHLAALFIVDWVKIMKVFVNDLPKEPKECLFSVSQIIIDHTQKKWLLMELVLRYESHTLRPCI